MKRFAVKRSMTSGIVLAAVLAAAAAGLWRTRSHVPASPPAAVVEGFVSALADHRFDAAMPYLSDRLRAQTIPMTLEVRTINLERRTGRISAVRGRAGWQVDTRAYAIAEADTQSAGPLELGFGLLRDDEAWRIDELYDLYR